MLKDNFYITNYSIAIKIVVYSIIFLALYFLLTAFFTFFIKRLEQQNRFYSKIFIHAIKLPIFFSLIASYIYYLLCCMNIWAYTNSYISNDSIPSIQYFLTYILSFNSILFLLSFINKAENSLLELPRDKPDTTAKYASIRALSILISIFTIIIFCQLIGIDIRGFITLSAAGTLVLGLASQQLLANFFGSLIIFLDKPFIIGDQISSAEKQIAGTVENIGFRVTTIRTAEGTMLYIPNSSFSSIGINNHSR